MSVCYEKHLDKTENFSLVKWILNVVLGTFFTTHPFGQIRINFSQPFSLKVSKFLTSYLNTLQDRIQIKSLNYQILF